MNKLLLLFRYFRFIFASKTRHGVHSPFIYNLIEKVIYNNSAFTDYTEIEEIRKDLLKNHTSINVTDLGAGSKNLRSSKRKVSSIARTSLSSRRLSGLLYRLANHFRPDSILELGTSLGISTLYLAMSNQDSKVYTIEGCPEISSVAKTNFNKSSIKNIEQFQGNFDLVLPEVLNNLEKLDFAYFDGNHRKCPTLNYFLLCLNKAHNNSVFIFDDIHWSLEMEEAWEEIKKHPSVTATIDLFFIGIVFFRKEQPKEHFKIRY